MWKKVRMIVALLIWVPIASLVTKQLPARQGELLAQEVLLWVL
jgi:hypothetical protein